MNNRIAQAERSLQEERAKCANIERLLQRSQLAESCISSNGKMHLELSDSVKLPSLGPDMNYNYEESDSDTVLENIFY